MSRKRFFIAFILVAALMAGLQGHSQFSNPANTPLSATTVPQAELLQPDELVQKLKASGAERPVLFQVGSHVMFQQAHIPGSVYAGPGSQAAGMQAVETTR